MLIKDGWTREDAITGLKITAVDGKYRNRLHVWFSDLGYGRDFFFNPDGTFDEGTGSRMPGEPEAREPAEVDAKALREAERYWNKIKAATKGEA